MDKSEPHKKENQSTCNKTQAMLECESLCKEMLKCTNQPVAPTQVKKKRELFEGVEEFFIFWS